MDVSHPPGRPVVCRMLWTLAAALVGVAVLVPPVVFAAKSRGAGERDNDRASARARRGGQQRDRVFFITGTARHDRDPENQSNSVLRLRSVFNPENPAGAQHGAIARLFRRPTKVWELDNQLEVKAWFENPHTCGVGSPRMALAIDRDGDGDSDGNAFGYFGTPPNFTQCPRQVWLYEDFTGPDSITGLAGSLGPSGPPNMTPNEQLEWDLTQFGGPFLNTWTQVEAFFSTNGHRRHHVCAARYVEDFGAPPGTSYADIITMGDAVWDGPEDTAGRADPFAPNQDPCKFRARPDDRDRDDDDDDDDRNGRDDDDDRDDNGRGDDDDDDGDDDDEDDG
jgi:hypothetical protein